MAAGNENSYRNILKGVSLFGSVQILQILINVTRGKLVAYLLGPSGMGISSLFASSSLSIQRLCSLGLNLAIVKEVAAASGDKNRMDAVVAAARTLIILTAFLAAMVCVTFSGVLSRLTFGDESMKWQFILLGIATGLTVAFNGKLSILQGLHEIKKISKASIAGGLTGLLAGVPLYYFFGTHGIVPAMIILAVSMSIFYSFLLKRSGITPFPQLCIRWTERKSLYLKLLTMGILLMSNDLIASVIQYLINIFINSRGSTGIVGLYQAANSITAQYSGVVFAVMAMDYFPRLSKVAGDNSSMRDVVNRQLSVTGLIIAPASGLLIITSPLLIRLLLTDEFLPVTELMRWMGLGIMFRSLMTPLGYISFAKGNKKLFFWMEGVGCNLLTLTLSCGFFKFYGLTGLGYAMVADNILCLVLYYFVNRRLYSFRFSRTSLIVTLSTVVITSLLFLCSFSDGISGYMMMGILLASSSAISLCCFRKLMKN